MDGPVSGAEHMTTRQPLTVAELIAQLVRCDDHAAIPEFTLDDETYFHVFAVIADESIRLEVEPATYPLIDWRAVNAEQARG